MQRFWFAGDALPQPGVHLREALRGLPSPGWLRWAPSCLSARWRRRVSLYQLRGIVLPIFPSYRFVFGFPELPSIALPFSVASELRLVFKDTIE